MPDWLAGAWSYPGLGWLAAILFVAGLVRGFAGFGTALIFMPLSALFLPPVWAIIVLIVLDLTGPLPLLPRAIRDGDLRDVAVLALGCALCIPLGTMLLERIDPELFRWCTACLALCMVALLVSGWRHDVRLGRVALGGIGGVGGFLGGFTGMPGPPVILTYMSGRYAATTIRGNTILYLMAFDVMVAITFGIRGLFVPEALAVAVLLAPPYLLGNMAGARLFDPAHAGMYRWVAYSVIAGSAIMALPILG